jgi:hypothetical protein
MSGIKPSWGYVSGLGDAMFGIDTVSGAPRWCIVMAAAMRICPRLLELCQM